MTSGASRLRIVVDRADAPTCGMQVGDAVDIQGPRLMTHGRPFCPLALSAVIPVLACLSTPLPVDHWLVRKPYLRCPRAEDHVVLRIDVVEEQSCE